MQRVMMNRRLFACGLGSVIAGLPGGGCAEAWTRRRSWAPWTKVPSIVVVSTVTDGARVVDAWRSDVDEAARFWNETLRGLGSPFRLGAINHVPEAIPYESMFESVYSWRSFNLSKPGYNYWITILSDLPTHIRRLNGDVIVALTEASGPSFAMAQHSPDKALVVIRNRMRLSGKVLQNTIAHEFGHVIGLGHNTNPTALMCGDVGYITQCSFEGVSEGFLPLTNSDKAALIDMYPPHWSGEEAPQRPWKGDPPVAPNVRFGGRVRAGS